MTISNIGACIGIIYSVPIVIWSLGQSYLLAPGYEAVVNGAYLSFRTLLITQFLSVALTLPWFVLAVKWRDALLGGVMQIIVPFPFLVILWLMGASDMTALFMSQISVMVYCIAILAISLLVLCSKNLEKARFITVAALQITFVAVTWISRHDLLQWYMS